MNRTALVTALLLSTFAAPSFAQSATPQVDQRQARQQERINQGVSSGALTPKETAAVNKREAKIDANQQAAQADGKVTRGERRKLRREEKRAGKAIARKKHNDKVVAQ